MTMHAASASRRPKVAEPPADPEEALAKVRAAIRMAPPGPPLSEEERADVAHGERLPRGAWLSTDDVMAHLARLAPGQGDEDDGE